MNKKGIKRLIAIAAIVLIGMIATQTYILIKTWDIKDQEFDQSIRIMLRQTAERIALLNNTQLHTNLIKRQSSNVYAVNINSTINANVLEEYLLQEMNRHSIKVDFEYAVYDCHNQELVYGNYCTMDKLEPRGNRTIALFDDMDYYFVISFPTRPSYLLSNMSLALILCLLSISSILFFIYMIFIILRQRKLSEMQNDFINNMTHEFKTPIASIKLAAEGLEKYTSQSNDRRTKRYSAIIKDQSKLLNSQVEKVLQLAKSNDSQIKLNIELIKVDDLIKQLIIIENQRNNVDIKIKRNDRVLISADRLHLINILRNLIDNATKYNKDNNDIYISSVLENSLLNISVEDHGIGIPKKDLEQIFDKFYRVHTGNIHNVKGFGLGLFYVKNICNAHKWEITTTSKEGLGTKITIKIKTNAE